MGDSIVLKIQTIWDRARRHLRSQRSIYIILSVYLICCLFYYIFFVCNWPTTKCWFSDDNFAVSFKASFAEDLMFFVALSIVIIVVTTKPIHLYSYSDKIAAIINSDHAKESDYINLYVQNNIDQILGYTKNFDIDLTVMAYNGNQTAYKVFVEQTYIIASICNDKDYYLEEYGKFSVAEFDATVGSEYGQVTLCDLTDLSFGSNSIPPFVDPKDPHILTPGNPFVEHINLGLRRDQLKRVRLNYHGWSKTCEPDKKFEIDTWNSYTSNRYADEVSVQIRNRFNKPLKYEIYTFKPRLKGENKFEMCKYGTIMQNKSLDSPLILKGELYPGDNVSVYFYPQ